MEFGILGIIALWLGVSWGLTAIIVQSRLLSSVRDWFVINWPLVGYMLECYQCMGFWIGGGASLLLGLSLPPSCQFFLFTPEISIFIIWGLAASGVIFIIRNLISKSL
jgi:hypothetical protein